MQFQFKILIPALTSLSLSLPSLASGSSYPSITLAANFSEAFLRAEVGKRLPYKDVQTGRDLSKFQGTISCAAYTGETIELKVRGKSSLNTATFPKLHILLDGNVANHCLGLPAINPGKFKIGTHLGEVTESQPTKAHKQKHRLANQLSPLREAFVYQMMEALGLPTLYSQIADVTYLDIGGQYSARQLALFFEHHKTFATRTGLKLIAKEGNTSRDSHILDLTRHAGNYFEKVDYLSLAKLMYFQVLIGNWDYRVPSHFHGNISEDRLHNVYLFGDLNGRWQPVAYDFDLASIVTGQLFYPRKGVGHMKGDLNLQNLMRTRMKWVKKQIYSMPTSYYAKRAIRGAVINHFAHYMGDVYKLLNYSDLDEFGKSNARKHIETFYEILLEGD